jgi:hypothetical protein
MHLVTILKASDYKTSGGGGATSANNDAYDEDAQPWGFCDVCRECTVIVVCDLFLQSFYAIGSMGK